jgi:hypothetical protein
LSLKIAAATAGGIFGTWPLRKLGTQEIGYFFLHLTMDKRTIDTGRIAADQPVNIMKAV